MPVPQQRMVMTTLEGRVEASRWGDLRQAFADGLDKPEPGLVQTFLAQTLADPAVWRIVTIWRDASALDAMRAAGPPRGPLMFRSAGSEPTLVIASVEGHREPGS